MVADANMWQFLLPAECICPDTDERVYDGRCCNSWSNILNLRLSLLDTFVAKSKYTFIPFAPITMCALSWNFFFFFLFISLWVFKILILILILFCVCHIVSYVPFENSINNYILYAVIYPYIWSSFFFFVCKAVSVSTSWFIILMNN